MQFEEWAWEKNHGFDAEGHERREACHGIAECSVCGKDVELIAETEGWTQGDDGRWHHLDYAPAIGVCCGKLIADWFDGCFVYDLSNTDDQEDDQDYEDAEP